MEKSANSPDSNHDQVLTTRLVDLILKMSPHQKEALLTALEEGNLSARRKHPRKSCFIVASYTTKGTTHIDMVQNISAGGAFIETDKDFIVGEEVELQIGNVRQRRVKLKGKIVRTTLKGIGIKFLQKLT